MTHHVETTSAAGALADRADRADRAERADRRTFLTRAAVAAAGAGAAVLLAPAPALAVQPALTFGQIPGTGDVKVLNYALALEALETELYRQAVLRLTSGGVDDLGHRFAGLQVSSTTRAVRFTSEFAQVERQHRDFLINALGGESLLKAPPFKNARFDFGISKLDAEGVLKLVYTAEKTGTGAYLGAIPYFATKKYLPVAGAIQGTEARHTAVIADTIRDYFPDAAASVQVAPNPNQMNGRDAALPPDQVLAAVSPFIVL